MHAVVLNVASPPSPEAAVLADITSLEAERTAAEKHMFDEAVDFAKRLSARHESDAAGCRANGRDHKIGTLSIAR